MAATFGPNKGGGLPPLDPNLLAAYVDGMAGQEEVELVEARLASDLALLEELIELRGLCHLKPAPISASMLNQAKALVLAQVTRKTHSQPPLYTWWRHLQWAAAAAAILLACLGSYSIGQVTFRNQQWADSLAASRVSLEIEELISEPSLDIMLAAVNGRNER